MPQQENEHLGRTLEDSRRDLTQAAASLGMDHAEVADDVDPEIVDALRAELPDLAAAAGPEFRLVSIELAGPKAKKE